MKGKGSQIEGKINVGFNPHWGYEILDFIGRHSNVNLSVFLNRAKDTHFDKNAEGLDFRGHLANVYYN